MPYIKTPEDIAGRKITFAEFSANIYWENKFGDLVIIATVYGPSEENALERRDSLINHLNFMTNLF